MGRLTDMSKHERFQWFGQLQKVDDNDDGSITVYGIASSESKDRAGETVTADAMKAALPDFFAHGTGNLREMHQLSAVGTVDEADVDDDGFTRIVATVVDPTAILKVKAGVYKGFSVGGRVLARAKEDAKKIVKLLLNEISLVDRPAQPDAVLTLWKVDDMADELNKRDYSDADRKKMAKSGEAMSDGSYPIADKADLENAIRAFGRAKDKPEAKAHIVKRAKALGATDMLPKDWDGSTKKADDTAAEGDDALQKGADAGEAGEVAAETGAAGDADEAAKAAAAAAEAETAAEAKPGTEAETTAEPDDAAKAAGEDAQAAAQEPDAMAKAAAAAEKLNSALAAAKGPDTIEKGMYAVSGFADMLQSLAYMCQNADREAMVEGDNSPVPAQLREWLKGGIEIFTAMAAEESAELVAATSTMKADYEKALTDKAVADALAKADTEAADLRKSLGERDDTLAKLAETMESAVGTIDSLAKRLGQVEDTVLPPKTAGALAKGAPVSKELDAAGNGGGAPEAPSADDLAKALATMSDDERTVLLIKAAHLNPTLISR